MLNVVAIRVCLILLVFYPVVFAQAEPQSPVPLPRSKPQSELLRAQQTLSRTSVVNEESYAFKTCLSSLQRRGVKVEIAQPVQLENGCHIANPVKVIAVAAGSSSIRLPAQPVLNCGFALRFSSWLSDVAAPVVQSFSKSSLKSLATGPGYVCRTRNNKKGAKISEHGFGNAIDITGFQLAKGRSIPISALPDGPSHKVRMLSALRISACGFFTTVLGPGANAAHKSHFHFDYGKHGRTWNYRICE